MNESTFAQHRQDPTRISPEYNVSIPDFDDRLPMYLRIVRPSISTRGSKVAENEQFGLFCRTRPHKQNTDHKCSPLMVHNYWIVLAKILSFKGNYMWIGEKRTVSRRGTERKSRAYRELQSLRTILKLALWIRSWCLRLCVSCSLCDCKKKAKFSEMSKCGPSGEVNRRSAPSFELLVFDQKAEKSFRLLSE